jgi:hypothetical protein
MREPPSILCLKPSRLLTVVNLSLAVASGVIVPAGAASAQSHLHVLHAFNPTDGWGLYGPARVHGTDGAYPQTSLIQVLLTPEGRRSRGGK